MLAGTSAAVFWLLANGFDLSWELVAFLYLCVYGLAARHNKVPWSVSIPWLRGPSASSPAPDLTPRAEDYSGPWLDHSTTAQDIDESEV